MKLTEKYQLISDLVGNDVMITKVHASSRSQFSKSLRPLVERFQFELAHKKGFKPNDLDTEGGNVQENKCYLYEYNSSGIYHVFIFHHKEKTEFQSLRKLLEWPVVTCGLKNETLQTMSKEKLSKLVIGWQAAASDQIAKHGKNIPNS